MKEENKIDGHLNKLELIRKERKEIKKDVDKEKRKIHDMNYRIKHREIEKERVKNWRKNNPEKIKSYSNIYNQSLIELREKYKKEFTKILENNKNGKRKY